MSATTVPAFTPQALRKLGELHIAIARIEMQLKQFADAVVTAHPNSPFVVIARDAEIRLRDEIETLREEIRKVSEAESKSPLFAVQA